MFQKECNVWVSCPQHSPWHWVISDCKVSSISHDYFQNRDPEFKQIVNVVPLEGGFCLVMQPSAKQTGEDPKKTIHLVTLQRLFEFVFATEEETKDWLNDFQMVLSSQIKCQSYMH